MRCQKYGKKCFLRKIINILPHKTVKTVKHQKPKIVYHPKSRNDT